MKNRPYTLEQLDTLNPVEVLNGYESAVRAQTAPNGTPEYYEQHNRFASEIGKVVHVIDDLRNMARAGLVEGLDPDALIPTCLAVCKQRGWSLHWTARGAYLHLESSELIEAWRGKGKSTVAEEAGDVLLVLLSILGAAGVTWGEALSCARDKMKDLETRPRYAGEEYSTSGSEARNG